MQKKTAAFLGSPICMHGSGLWYYAIITGAPRFFSSNDDGKLSCSYLVGCLIRQRGAWSTRFHGAPASVKSRPDGYVVVDAFPCCRVTIANKSQEPVRFQGQLSSQQRRGDSREREKNIHLDLEQQSLFVTMSPTWSSLVTKSTLIRLLATDSWTKWCFTSIYLLWPWNTGVFFNIDWRASLLIPEIAILLDICSSDIATTFLFHGLERNWNILAIIPDVLFLASTSSANHTSVVGILY